MNPLGNFWYFQYYVDGLVQERFSSALAMDLLLSCASPSMFKGLITVGKELRQQHPSDLLSYAGKSREHSWTTNHKGVVAITPNRQWSIPIITWLNNFVWNIFTAKYVENPHGIMHYRLLASIVMSGFHCDVTILSLVTGIVALHILSWRVQQH